MKIIFVIKSLKIAGGGAERVMVDIANGLFLRGHEIHVITFDYPGKVFYDLSFQIKKSDIALVDPNGGLISRLGLLGTIPRIRNIISVERPDVIVAFMPSAYVPVSLAALGLGVPFIASEHTDAVHYKDKYFQRIIRKFADRLAAIVTVPSESSRLSFVKAEGRDSEVVHNPVHQYKHKKLPPQNLIDPTLVNVGSMRPEKDQSILLDAFANVSPMFPNWRLQIFGDGPLREDLEQQVLQLGIFSQIEMPGFIKDVGRAYANSQFVVLPSQYESFGMVAAEALAAGRAVVSFDNCGGVNEMVKNGINGILVYGALDRNERVEALSDGLTRMMSDNDFCIQLGAAGPASVVGYNIEMVLDRWEEILGQVKTKCERDD